MKHTVEVENSEAINRNIAEAPWLDPVKWKRKRIFWDDDGEIINEGKWMKQL